MRILKSVVFFFLFASPLGAQGMLPRSTETVTAVAGVVGIGERVPETLAVTPETGKIRTLLSYKSALDIMAVAFLSDGCEENKELRREVRRFYDRFEGWKVAWLAIDTREEGPGKKLSEVFQEQGVKVTVVQDPGRKVVKTLGVRQVPTLVLIDEWGVIQYRGPFSKADQALTAMIGHVEPVSDPEPPLEKGCPL